MEAKDLNEARIYVGTYAKYNNGSLQGEWVELSDFYDLDGFMEREFDISSMQLFCFYQLSLCSFLASLATDCMQ